jgi:CRP/FNR family transcriptional regulator
MDEKLVQVLEKFFSKYKTVKYGRGEMVAKPGENLDFVGFIKSGYVRVYTLNDNGQEVTMQFFKPVLYFTTIMAMTGIENRYYFEAVSPVEMYVCPKNEAMEYFKKDLEVGTELMKSIMSAFLDLTDQIGYLLSGTAYNKIAATLISLTNNKNNSGKINFGITHKMLASLTGLTRETVTLQMIKLDRAKIIQNKSKTVEILDEERLKKIATGGTL